MIRARAEVEALTPYVAPLEGRRPMLRLDFNESTAGPSPRVLEAIRSLPPAAYAESVGVPERHVEAFNGVDAAIRAIFDAYGEKGSTFLTTAPTFGYYAPCAQQQGMVIDEVLYPDDLRFPLGTITRKLESRPRLLFICNPNNPTGTLVEPTTLVALARSVPQTLVVVDELYVAFTGRSVVPSALELPNVVALQSLSKAAGLAAREWTIGELRRLGVRCAGEGGNYLLVWPPGDCEGAVRALRDHGILVRSMAKKPVIDGSFRLTIGMLADMQRFVAAFSTVAAP